VLKQVVSKRKMQKILIDRFNVPELSRDAFIKASQKAQGFIKTLPGFVEGYLYERLKEDHGYEVLTVAVWENGKALEAAKEAVKVEYKKRGFDPSGLLRELGIRVERNLFDRTPY
jgi:heme-degrading monooxygenase HmoA